MNIKDCPFCGSSGKLWTRKCSSAKYAIGCTNIRCREFIPEDVHLRKLHNYAMCYTKLEQCMAEWNRRYSEDTLDI